MDDSWAGSGSADSSMVTAEESVTSESFLSNGLESSPLASTDFARDSSSGKGVRRPAPFSCPRPRSLKPVGSPPDKAIRVLFLPKIHENPFSPTPPRASSGERRAMPLSELKIPIGVRPHQRPSRFLEDFDVMSSIGKGSYGNVLRAVRRLDGWTYAVKVLDAPPRGADEIDDSLLREVHALAALDNPHIIRYFACWNEDNQLYVQTEFCEGDNLLKRVGTPFSEEQLKDILRQILDGLSHMHSKNIVHLDIKNENLYLTLDGTVKIGDFGLSCSVHARPAEEGDNRYLSCEVLDGKASDLTKGDIFSCGMSVYELALRRRLPATGEEYHAIRSGVLGGLSGNYSREFGDILRSMLHPVPSERPSASDLVNSPFLRPPLMNSEVERLTKEVAHLKAELKRLTPGPRRKEERP